MAAKSTGLALGALNAQASATATVFGRDPEWVLSFDREGRLLTRATEQSFEKRALDSRLLRRDRRDGSRWRVLDDAERRTVFAEALERAAETAADPAAPSALRERLESEVLPWTVDRLLAEEARFRAAYPWPISILPPDRYRSVVLQATEGCTWNRCTFCSFYQDRPFRAATPEAFRQHAEAVRGFLGRDAARRPAIFLADGNALALGNRRLRPLIEIASDLFPGRPFASFLDVYTGTRHDPLDWRELSAFGLEQVAIGMETGLDELLRWVNKPGSRDELAALVAELKAAGLALSLIVMIGLGGQSFRTRHREATLDALLAMPLDRRDLIYLSPFVEGEGSAYAARRAEEGSAPLTPAETEAETTVWTETLRARGRRVGRYDIREFVY
jgi:radical SAM superfamily enzyme YgiQ (UPF0313 family)